MEHYYQAKKVAFTNENSETNIMGTTDPRPVASVGKATQMNTKKREEWKKKGPALMKKAMLAKFTQNPKVRCLDVHW